MTRIAVASGKGGTGKTTVAVNLALTARRAGRRVRLCDCDVEEPNAHLFLEPEFALHRTITDPVPRIDPALCDGCGECADFCAFNALARLPDRILVFPDLCHGCGGCWRLCPRGAITPEPRPLGEVSGGAAGDLGFTEGRLRVGETLVPPLVAAVKETPGLEDWTLLDAPPGVTCPVVETLRGVDYALLVTEPTPFGVHDLEAALELVRGLGVPHGVVINRAGPAPGPAEDFCVARGEEILARIPFRRAVAAACAEGGLAREADPDVAAALDGLYRKLEEREATP